MSHSSETIDLTRMLRFEHEPLDLTQAGNVRLTRLLSTSDGHSIRCSMECNMSIDDTDYSAVSYEWGDPAAPRHDILINGGLFSIHQNLYSFLHSLVAQGCTEQLLWIDALCIDQQNRLEKNHQVAQMGQIYRNATNVFSWLGPAADESDQLFDFIENLQIHVRDELSSVAAFQKLSQDDWSAVRITMYETTFTGQRGLLTYAIRAICNRTYWVRQWVLQEVLLARNSVLFCGLESCKWLPFLMTMEAGWNPSTLSGYWTSQLQACSAMLMLQGWTERIEARAPETLQNLLFRYRKLRCSDTRDKIYALLSLAKSTAVSVKYGLTPAEVLVDAIDTFEDSISLQELGNLLRSVDVSAGEFLACCMQNEEQPMEQVVIDINEGRKHDMTDLESLMAYSLLSSRHQGRVNHKLGVQRPLQKQQTHVDSCANAPPDPTEIFVFRLRMRYTEMSPGPYFWPAVCPPYSTGVENLFNRMECRVCECDNCIKCHETFLELSDDQRACPEFDLSKSNRFIWSHELKTIHFIRRVDRRGDNQAETWAYCGSALFRYMEDDGSFSPLEYDVLHLQSETVKLPKSTSLFLYWDPTLYNMQYKWEANRRRDYWSCLFNARQIQTALLYHNHVIGGTAEVQQEDGRGSKHASPGSRLRDARIASARKAR